MTNHKCESCRKGFNGQNGNGYMPCGCRKAIYAKPLTPTEKSEAYQKLKDAMEVDLSKNPLYSKRNRIEPMPEFVPPPPLIPWNDTGLKVIHPWFYRASIYFAIGVMVGITGCLYATSHVS
ncbi:hypothetical protein [Acinetobacter sp. YH12254]|uniref:hypothetical protein n=1 Tax=Acinetobacter sp. YH12254 TaxID=2601178 RepID=UPI0015D1812A|nr:hypothetical protein [Acinetobacter sp. YH12254]